MLNRFLFSGLITCLLLSSCFENKRRDVAIKESVTAICQSAVDTFPRKSITFILGKDENLRNPYYSLANQYYRLSDSEKTEMVVDTLISLLEVRNYLSSHRPENGRPWGQINLVSHGNEFIDLSVLISPTGSRVSEESLQRAIADSVFMPLDSFTADKKTQFILHGCSVGNNIALLNALATAFGGNKNPANIKASKLFEYYAYLSQNKNPQMIRHYYAKVWYAYYKTDADPSEEFLTEQLKRKYPKDNVNWIEAIHKQFPSNPSEAYHINLNIPVVWENFYEDKNELPDWSTKTKQLKWLENQTEFFALLKKTNIPQEYFNIKFYVLNYEGDKGIVYSSKVKAKTGVVCIIKPILRNDNSQIAAYLPFIPEPDDRLYFGFNNR